MSKMAELHAEVSDMLEEGVLSVNDIAQINSIPIEWVIEVAKDIGLSDKIFLAS